MLFDAMLLYVFALVHLCDRALGEGPIVTTPSGPVQGLFRQFEDYSTTNFLGIPYAEPPIGNRRFELPLPKSVWSDVRDASHYGNSCLQNRNLTRSVLSEWIYESYLKNLTTSEDCLFLNIFIPGDMSSDSITNLPVMVYFHGGGFLFGHSAFRMYEGDWLANAGNVIVVSVNYRLSILGFFTTGTNRLQGNAGLYDQHLALQWVRDNIASFGGDPQQVTIFGQSAGGGSVSYHDVSPLSRGLFSRVILMSAASQDLGNRPEDYRDHTLELAWELGCADESQSDEDMLSCLKQLPAQDFIEWWVAYAYYPCIDGTFVPDILGNLYDRGEFSQVPHLMGTTSGEGTLVFSVLDADYLDEGLDELELDIFMTLLVEITGYENFDSIYAALESFYIPDGDTSDYLKNIARMVDMITDFVFESPKGLVADAMTKYNIESYMYLYTHRASYRRQYAVNYGAHHGDELMFVFGAVLENGILTHNVTEAEKLLSRSTMRTWLSFVKGENPTFLDNGGNSIEIPVYTDDERAYVEFSLDMTSESIKSNLKKDAIYLWNVILPSIGMTTIIQS